jgi:hypothetical protein
MRKRDSFYVSCQRFSPGIFVLEFRGSTEFISYTGANRNALNKVT